MDIVTLALAKKELKKYKSSLANELGSDIAEGTDLTLDKTAEFDLILTLKGNTSQNQYEGYNLFESNSYPVSRTLNGVTITNNGDGSFTLNGTCTVHNTNIQLGGTSKIQNILAESSIRHTAYYVSGTCTKAEGSSSTFCVLRLNYNIQNSMIHLEQLKDAGVISKTNSKSTATTGWSWTITLEEGDTFDNFTIKYMLVKGTEELPFEPYVGGQASPNSIYPQPIHVLKGSNTITISNSDNTKQQIKTLTLPNGMEMCNIADYRDEFMKDLSSNKWYKNKQINKYVFTGNETPVQYTSTSGAYAYAFQNLITNYLRNNANICICSHFISQENSGYSVLTDGKCNFRYSSNDTNKFLYIATDDYTSIEEFKAFLAEQYQNGTPVTLYYILETPTLEEITDTTLINQLNDIKEAYTYQGQTNIMQENADLPFVIETNYKLSNLSRIEALEQAIN